MNKEQYDPVSKCLQSNLIFIDTPVGIGKIFVNNLILSKIKGDGDIAIAIVSS